MKSAAAKLRILNRNPSIRFSPPPFLIGGSQPCTTLTANCSSSSAVLNDEELKQINALIPRLCSSNHLKTAIHLVSAALSTADPPLNSLPLSTVVNRLSLEPDLTLPMHLLNSLKHNPNAGNPNILSPIARMLAASFFRTDRPQRAFKVFQWVSRPDFPGGAAAVDLEFYSVLIDGFCRHGMVLESIRVVRAMASANLKIGNEIRLRVYRGLLREARVREAVRVNEALERCTLRSDGGPLGYNELVDLLDQMIANWVE